jgi:uncharacterized protein YgfB (UPF0149 family)
MSRFADVVKKYSASYYAHSVLLALIPAALFLLFSGMFVSGSLGRSLLALLFAVVNTALFPYSRIVYEKIAAHMRKIYEYESDSLSDDGDQAERALTLFVKTLCKSVFVFAFWLLALPIAPFGWWMVRR